MSISADWKASYEALTVQWRRAQSRITELEAVVAQDERLYEELRMYTQKLEAALREIDVIQAAAEVIGQAQNALDEIEKILRKALDKESAT